MSPRIFVFGSNLAGVHGAGAARTALQKHGAVWGVGTGLQGSCYALPTKDKHIKTLPLGDIEWHVNDFIGVAKRLPNTTFQVTRVGCGLAGLSDCLIAPMFRNAPPNCQFDEVWCEYLGNSFHYWGTY